MSLIKRLFAEDIHFTCLSTLILDGELCFLGLINSCNFHQESQCSHFARTIFQTKYIIPATKKKVRNLCSFVNFHSSYSACLNVEFASYSVDV